MTDREEKRTVPTEEESPRAPTDSGRAAATAYGSQEFEDNYPEGIQNHFWNSARNDIILRKLRAANAVAGMILDIGCGPGITLEYLRQRGLPCIGVEAGIPPVHPGIKPFVHAGVSAFELEPSLRREVTTILLLDVIEHIEHSTEFLRNCRSAFPGLRTLLVTVPARMELWSNYDTRFGHYRRYNRATLRAELKGAGFEPVEIGYLFHSLYPVMYYLARVRKRRKSDLEAPRRLWPHWVLRRYFRVEAACVPGAIAGTSLLALARPGE